MGSFSLQEKKGVAILTFDLKEEKVNKLSLETLDELDKILDEAKNLQPELLLLESGKEGNFIAGLDLKKMDTFLDDPSFAKKVLEKGHLIFRKLENLPFPTFALIKGACLGGGLELALSCTFRLAANNSKTILGLPETTLGIVPGWGGTVRLPHLVGLRKGVELILSGKILSAEEAKKARIIDETLSLYDFEEGKEALIERLKQEKTQKLYLSRRKKRSFSEKLIEGNPIGRAFFFHMARKNTLKKTAGNYPAPLSALAIIEKNAALPYKKAVEKDLSFVEEEMAQGFTLAKYLVPLFFTQEALKKDPQCKPVETVLPIKRAAVCGAGTMGSLIAWLFATRGYQTILKDISYEAIGRGGKEIGSVFSQLKKIRKLKHNQQIETLTKIHPAVSNSELQHADIVVEAIVEDLALKKELFSSLEQIVGKDTILATNTSSFSISSLQEGLERGDRVIGMHFFNPVNRMPLVEIVAGEKTSEETIQRVVSLCKSLKKTAIVVKDCPGFLVNRIFVVGLIQMLGLVERGVSIARIDRLMTSFGLPMEPFFLADVVGNDVNKHVLKTFLDAYGSRMETKGLIDKMVEKGFLGKKSGKGFYLHQGGKKRLNDEVPDVIKTLGVKPISIEDEEIVSITVFSMVNEAARCLEEGIVKNPSYLDLALIMGCGFPPFRGGLLRYAEAVGLETLKKELWKLSETFPFVAPPSDALLKKERFF